MCILAIVDFQDSVLNVFYLEWIMSVEVNVQLLKNTQRRIKVRKECLCLSWGRMLIRLLSFIRLLFMFLHQSFQELCNQLLVQATRTMCDKTVFPLMYLWRPLCTSKCTDKNARLQTDTQNFNLWLLSLMDSSFILPSVFDKWVM